MLINIKERRSKQKIVFSQKTLTIFVIYKISFTINVLRKSDFTDNLVF